MVAVVLLSHIKYSRSFKIKFTNIIIVYIQETFMVMVLNIFIL